MYSWSEIRFIFYTVCPEQLFVTRNTWHFAFKRRAENLVAFRAQYPLLSSEFNEHLDVTKC